MNDLSNLLASLVEDVLASKDALSGSDTPVNRRNLIRATLAASEGLIWLAQQNVREIAQQMGQLEPIVDLALQSSGYEVRANGTVQMVARFVPITTGVKMLVKQAERITPKVAVTFGDAGWHGFTHAIDVRNRLMHPKSPSELIVKDADISMTELGFDWLLATVTHILGHVVAEFRGYVGDFNDLLNDLRAGDPDALKQYHALLRDT